MSEETDAEKEDEADERNLGVQPLDALMEEHGLTNHDLVELDRVHLTHKAIGRARKGRKLTRNTQQRVLMVVNAALKAKGIEAPIKVAELFNYKG